ncbi:MAG: murein L,D-transpeptidase catalytic domain family protein [Bacteroidetes bacterium]|nr:murein L,D-transpeptidase catalytic domain family protein [Bacteroidota bacterium]
MRLMFNAAAFLPALLLMANASSSHHAEMKVMPAVTTVSNPVSVLPSKTVDYYAAWHLNAAGLSQDAFDEAMKGYHYLQDKKLLNNTHVITIIDYSKASSQKRLFVVDMNSGDILFNTLVAHGRNSGLEYASSFSNSESSHKTSLGFFITMNTYTGNHGLSLRLQGCEKGINDRAYKRSIVLHGAGYVNEKFVQRNGYLGRSFGCPAIPEGVTKSMIDVIKNGSCMFLYHPTKKYSTISKILNS